MRAIVYDRYGPPEVLQLADLPVPAIGDRDVLVRVRAVSVNAWDWDLVTGTPVVFRFWGLFRPKHRVPGADVAGVVEAVGQAVTRFAPGDEVFGDLSAAGWGALADYARAPEAALAPKPAGMSFAQAAAVPQAGAMALQGLRDEGGIEAGQAVLINGAGGGVGTFAIQIAKAFGAVVTGVDRGDKLATMRAVGADQVIDYTQVDFTRAGAQYDLILDVSAHRSPFAAARALKPGGRYVMLGGEVRRILQVAAFGALIGRAERKRLRLMAARPNHDLAFLGTLFAAGKLRPVIEREYPLAEAAAAFRSFGAGGVRGKVVVVT